MKKPVILVLGADGMVGHTVFKYLKKKISKIGFRHI